MKAQISLTVLFFLISSFKLTEDLQWRDIRKKNQKRNMRSTLNRTTV